MKKSDDFINAIDWSQNHKHGADEMYKKVYDKVYKCYRTDVIYEMHRKLYREVVNT